MVRIPEPVQQGQEVGSVKQSDLATPFMNVRPADTSAVGKDISSLGSILGKAAEVLRSRREESNILDAEMELFEWEKAQLDPKTGMASQKNGAASGVTDRTSASFAETRERIMNKYGSGIGRSGKMAMEELLNGAEKRAWMRSAEYETGQLDNNAKLQHAASVDALGDLMSYRLYYGDTEGALAAAANLTNRLEDEAARLGYPEKAIKEYVEAGRTDAWSKALIGMANSGQEIEAEERTQALIDEGIIDASDGVALLNQISPLATEKRNKIAAGTALATVKAPPGQNAVPAVNSVFDALIFQESGYGPRFGGTRTLEDAVTVRSPKGATGLTQIMPDTMSDPGFGVAPYRYANGVPEGTPLQVVVAEQKRFSRDYLGAMLKKFDGNMQYALYAYNWGHSSVSDWIRNGADMAALPKETREYAQNIMQKSGYTVQYVPSDRREPGDKGRFIVDDGLTARDRLMRDHGAGAVSEFDKLVSAEYTRANAAQSQLYGATIAEIDRLFAESKNQTINLDQIFRDNPGMREQLGDKVATVRAYVDRRNKREDAVTDPVRYGALATLRETDPAAFARTNLIDYINDLAPSDLKAFQDDQADVLGTGGRALTYSDINDKVGYYISGALAGQKDSTAKKAAAIHQIRMFADDYFEQTGKPMTDVQLLTFAERAARDDGEFSVNMAARWAWDGWTRHREFKGVSEDTFKEAYEELDKLGEDVYLGSPEDMVFTLPDANNRPLDVIVTQADRKRIFEELQSSLGRRPTADDMLTAIIIANGNMGMNP